MSTCISVPIIIGNDTLYKNIYTGEVSSEPQFSASLFELSKDYSQLNEQLSQSDEAALTLYEAQAATDEAILAIYEKIGGTTA